MTDSATVSPKTGQTAATFTSEEMLRLVLGIAGMSDPLLGTRRPDARRVQRAARRAQDLLAAYRRLTGLHDDDLTLASAWLATADVLLSETNGE